MMTKRERERERERERIFFRGPNKVEIGKKFA